MADITNPGFLCLFDNDKQDYLNDFEEPGKIQNKDEILSKAGVVGCKDFGEWIKKGN